MKMINTTNYEVDSFTIRIPADKVRNNSNILNSFVEQVTFRTTADPSVNEEIPELTETKVISSHYTKDAEIPTTYEVRNYFNNTKGIKAVEQYYLIKVTSKHLRQRYFEGITKDNIEEVYKSIMHQNIIFVEYQDFLNSTCIDVDFKKDNYNQNYQDFLNQVNLMTIPKKSIGKGIKTFDKKYNQGFQFGSRKYATLSSPYIKYYNKQKQIGQLEKYKGMNEFYTKYLEHQGYEINNLFRVEYTVKGKEMFERYGASLSNKLIDILNAPNEVKQGIAKDIFAKHTEKITRVRSIKAKLTPNQKKSLMIKDLCIKLGMSRNQIEQYVKGYELRSEPYNQLMNELDTIDFDNEEERLSKQIEKNNYIASIMQSIGLD